jgi:hypothetical protein
MRRKKKEEGEGEDLMRKEGEEEDGHCLRVL